MLVYALLIKITPPQNEIYPTDVRINAIIYKA